MSSRGSPSSRNRRCAPVRTLARGFTLVELMVSMVLGLVIVGGVVSILVANKRTYGTSEALSQVQESARTAFEMLAHDVRSAGATGCDRSGRIANVLDPTKGNAWWQTWFGIIGYDGDADDPAVTTGTATGERIEGTDSIAIQGIEGLGLSVVNHDAAAASLKISSTTTSFVPGDVLMVCDFDHAAIFQVTNYNSANVTLVHNAGESQVPSNCSKGLGFPTVCDGAVGNAYSYGPNSQLARFQAVDWYVGNNGRPEEGGRSLYRRRLASGGTVVTEEVVAGVSDMQITYRLDGTDEFSEATDIDAADWANVNAVSITLTLDSASTRVSSDPSVNSGRLQRSFTHLITLRNRVP